jgi:cystathionine gamma-synthase
MSSCIRRPSISTVIPISPPGTLTTARDDEYWQRLRAVRAQHGALLGSFEAWLLLRGMRTLFVRVRQACASAQALAERFSAHPRISEVLYPGLPGFRGHEVAARQMKGGLRRMMSIRVKDGEAAAIATAARVRVWKRATSLGGVESLIEHRASVEGAGTPAPADLSASLGRNRVGRRSLRRPRSSAALA